MEPAIRFCVDAVCPETGARAGRLHTPHGVIETPVFMPVGTQATVKGLTPRHLAEELDARIILGNTYHLYLRPGHELIRNFGGLHGFMHWDRAILTDSGGFQVFSLDGLRKISDEGVVFRSHLNGDKHLFTPESTVDVQQALGSDIAMVLDECPPYPIDWRKAQRSMQRTVGWAERAFAHFRSLPDETRVPQALFPIVQGGMYADLRSECAARLVDLDAEGYAVGGLSVGEPRDVSMAMAAHTVPLLPQDRPRYVMGVGMPEELAQYVAHGVDMMDCVMPSRNARNGCLFTRSGRVVIKQARYREDPLPVDETCGCYTCLSFSRAYLRHLFMADEMLFCTLGTIHNLHHYLDIMRRIRESILEGRFPETLRALTSQLSGNAEFSNV
ncbi:MAG: tRNA guanosine(34) transglycosylase Tgt [Bryobacterales bacterium]|nr:tRNA guanosine(34) transglycosylase Tgt [Bryobacterales bacterium]